MTTDSELEELTTIVGRTWSGTGTSKSGRYVGKFFERAILGKKISGKVVGNHGTYTVSIITDLEHVSSACSCYIGKHGGCHHVTALALTFLREPDSFPTIAMLPLEAIENLGQLYAYLRTTTLDELTGRLRKAGITQKAFAESIGMNPQQITAMKASERRNRTFGELGATKLACLWVLEHLGKKD